MRIGEQKHSGESDQEEKKKRKLRAQRLQTANNPIISELQSFGQSFWNRLQTFARYFQKFNGLKKKEKYFSDKSWLL